MAQGQYRDILQSSLLQKQQANPAYSLRAFARDLEISPSRLSEVLSGKHSLSIASARKIAQHLHKTPDERQYFEDLVAVESSSNPLQIELAQRRINTFETGKSRNKIPEDSFSLISDWYYLCIIELTQLENFKPDAKWIAEKLGITSTQVVDAFERLQEVGIVQFDDDQDLILNFLSNTVSSQKSSKSIRKFHKQMIEKALAAIDGQKTNERDVSSLTVAVDHGSLPEIRKLIQNFRNELSEKSKQSSSKPNLLYNLNVQFFKIADCQNDHAPTP